MQLQFNKDNSESENKDNSSSALLHITDDLASEQTPGPLYGVGDT